MRSRRAYVRAVQLGRLADPDVTSSAAAAARHPLAVAWLAPHAAVAGRQLDERIARIVSGPLRTVAPGSARHLALVEAVRRLYQRAAAEADRRDKERALHDASRP